MIEQVLPRRKLELLRFLRQSASRENKNDMLIFETALSYCKVSNILASSGRAESCKCYAGPYTQHENDCALCRGSKGELGLVVGFFAFLLLTLVHASRCMNMS